MIWFNSNDLHSILVIVSCLFVNIALPYYPYILFFKKDKKYLPYFIVTSISIYILFGYLFYCFRSLNIYPITYLVFFVSLNIFLFVKNKHYLHLNFKPIINRSVLFKILVFLSLFFIFVYYFFYDALHFITPDNYYDVYNHMLFFDTIKSDGQIFMSYYAPGFHIFFYSAYLILGGPNIYRFMGPILGLVIITNLYFISSVYFTKKSSRILLLLLTLFPFFKLLSIQYITTWPTTTSYLFLPVLIALLFFDKLGNKKQLFLYALILTSFSLTLPYALLQYVPTTITVCLLSAFLFYKFKSLNSKYFLIISIVTASAIAIPALHVFLQTQVISKNGLFPPIQILKKENNKLIVSDVYQNTASTSNSTVLPTPITTTIVTPISKSVVLSTHISKTTKNKFFNPAIVNNYLLPFVRTIESALVSKTMVPLSKYSIKSYLYILISFFLAVFSIFTKRHKLFVISAFSFLFGLITQFGFLELTQYRGRTGPYIVFLSAITVVYFYDQIKFYQSVFASVVFLLTLIMVVKDKPLSFNREGVCPEIFEQVYLITKKFPNQPLNFIFRYPQISILSPNISAYGFGVESLKKSVNEKDTYLILQQNYCEQSPKEFSEANSHDPTYQYYIETKKDGLIKNKKITEDIKQSPEFSQFSLYWKDQNISVYYRPKQTN